MSKRLRFVLGMSGDFMEVTQELWQRFMPNGRYVLNRTEWRGKEPRSCAITRLKMREHSSGDAGPLIFDIEVTYRPKGDISYTGNTKYDGWVALVLDPNSNPPGYVPHEVYGDIEFNELEFGKFVEEVEGEAIRHLTFEAALKEACPGPGFRVSVHSSFTAPRRSRPNKKIILSTQPTATWPDRFGTVTRNINNATENLEHVLMEELTALMCEFVEGRVSIKNAGNEELTFVELSDSFVDCAPNEDGLDSFFEILHLHTPSSFLEELAKRLSSLYAIEVAVVDGERGGLLLRRECVQD